MEMQLFANVEPRRITLFRCLSFVVCLLLTLTCFSWSLASANLLADQSSTIITTTTNKSVPVLSISLHLDPRGYLPRLVRSIDFPVERLLIQIGNNDSSMVKTLVDAVYTALNHSIVRPNKVEIRTTKMNPGSANGFNLGLRALLDPTSSPSLPSWALVVNNDIAFYPGILYRISQTTERLLSENPKFGIGFTSLCCGCEWSAVIFTQRMVQSIGLMDENFYPAWFEDDDYAIRVHHGGFKAIQYNDTPLLHGEVDGSKDYVSGMMVQLYKTRHMDSSAWAWRRTFEASQGYAKGYLEHKWGIRITRRNRFDCKRIAAMNGDCKTGFLLPFNNAANNLSYWQLNQTARGVIMAAGTPGH